MSTVILLESEARTATANGPSINPGRRCFTVVDVTLDPASASITPNLQMYDPASTDWITIWTAAAALTATGKYVYYCSDITPTAAWTSITEVEELHFLPPIRFQMTVADTDSMTYSVSMSDEVVA